jgi:hypothetical protein
VDEDHRGSRSWRPRRRVDIHVERLTIGALVYEVVLNAYRVHSGYAEWDPQSDHLFERGWLFLHGLSSNPGEYATGQIHPTDGGISTGAVTASLDPVKR